MGRGNRHTLPFKERLVKEYAPSLSPRASLFSSGSHGFTAILPSQTAKSLRPEYKAPVPDGDVGES